MCRHDGKRDRELAWGGTDHPSAALFALASQLAAELGQEPPRGIAVGGASDGNYTAAAGCPTPGGLGVVGVVGGGAHADTEYVEVVQMVPCTRLPAQLIMRTRRRPDRDRRGSVGNATGTFSQPLESGNAVAAAAAVPSAAPRWLMPVRIDREIMALLQGRRFIMRQDMDRLGLGEKLGSYPIAGVGGSLAQMARRVGVVLYVIMIVCLAAITPPAAFAKGAVMTAVVFVLFGLMLAWRRMSARFGLRRCCLYTHGLVVTNLLGGVQDAVAWSEVTELNRLSGASVFMTFHRVEVARRGLRPLAFLALGLKPPLVDALLSQLAKNGVR
ncbi:M20/M25/M40 family metallo-hydrolase [Streptomyces sp. NPDC055025]